MGELFLAGPRALHLTSGAGRSKTRSDGESLYLGESVERLAFRPDYSLARPDVGLGSDFCF